ncbi:MAG: efflux RND transporter periplasmic adaptor subunit [Spongiibacteraceae bacterium]
MKRSHLVVLAVIITGLAATLALTQSRPEKTASAPLAALTVTTTTLERRPLQHMLTATGSIHAWQEMVIAPQLGGYRVESVNVDIGSIVKSGQELARLDSGPLTIEVQAQRAALAKAQALQNRAESAYRRGQVIAKQKLLSQSDLERLQSDHLAAQADTQAARANLDTAEMNLRHTRITAPSAGVVSVRSVNLGEIAQIGKSMFQLLRDGRIEWRAEVPEARLHQIHAGQTVAIRTADGKTLNGTVRSLDPTVDANKRNAIVYVDLPTPGSARPGMFARGDFLLGSVVADVIPQASVARSDGYSYVFVLGENQVVQRTRIETGALDGDRIEVLSGLVAGQRIVDTGASFLKDGDRVHVVARTVKAAVAVDGPAR